MTKIDQILPGQITPKNGEKAKGAPSKGPSFQEILDQAAKTSQDSTKTSAPTQAFDPLNLINGVKPTAAVEPLRPEQTQGLMHAERTMEILDDYQNALSDQSKSLKDMGRIVADMDGEVKQLTGVLEKLDPKDELYRILEDVAVTAMVESIKFNRGDYMPQEA
jgi:hypothetical protein